MTAHDLTELDAALMKKQGCQCTSEEQNLIAPCPTCSIMRKAYAELDAAK